MKHTGDAVAAIALLDEPTRRRLYEFVVASDTPVGRDAAAAGVGISRELAAFHLDRLGAAGLLDITYKRRSPRGGPGSGRPAKLYKRAHGDVTVSFPGRRYHDAADVLAEAVDRLHEESVVETVQDVARKRGRETGRAARKAIGPRPGRRKLDTALIDLLETADYEPIRETETGAVRLRNCPFHALAVDHRDLTCGMNLAWAEGIVEGLGKVPRMPKLAPTDGFCCVVFERATE